ncbi:MAG TPA: SLBB domain-containing protein [Fimbriimonas sp.]|nr:SLBB domain-containing protein [Fimbriimonas sp.]
MEAPTARHWVFGSVGVVMLGLIGYFGQARMQGVKPSAMQPLAKKESAPKESKPSEAPKILVEIRGAVKAPGIFEVKEGTRTRDLIQMAGGELPAADTSEVNLVRILRDGTRIDIPFKSKPKESVSKNSGKRTSTKTTSKKPKSEPVGVEEVEDAYVEPPLPDKAKIKREVDRRLGITKPSLNNATLETLKSMNKLSDSTAENIITYRVEHGIFKDWEDVAEVKGILPREIKFLKEWFVL